MIDDRFGGRHATANGASIEDFEGAVWNVLAHRPEAASHLDAALTASPDMIAAHALRGFCGVSLARRETILAARACAARARALFNQQDGSASERALVEALELAVSGRLLDAATRLDAHIDEAPRDLLAFKLSHGLRFMSGDARGMLAGAERVAGRWSASSEGYGFFLGCRAFALEENGFYSEAEAAGREAVACEPFDAWGAHAVGHVYEMQALAIAGARWLGETRGMWSGCNNFSFHMAWHLALCHLEQGDSGAALDLYDRHVRPVHTDDFRDFSNASSILLRLRQNGVAVGRRWDELADIARRRVDDTSLIFASAHYLLALLAVDDVGAARTLLSALAARMHEADDQAYVARSVGVDLGQALAKPWATAPGARAQIARRLAPLGGSKAQRDVFARMLAEAASLAGDVAETRAILASREKTVDRFAGTVEARLAGTAHRRVA